MAVHVVRLDGGSCDVTDTPIADQMTVLNDAYAGYGFQFSLASVPGGAAVPYDEGDTVTQETGQSAGAPTSWIWTFLVPTLAFFR